MVFRERTLINSMLSMAPNIVFVPNITQNAEHRHRTQDTNTAHFRSSQAVLKYENALHKKQRNQKKISKLCALTHDKVRKTYPDCRLNNPVGR